MDDFPVQFALFGLADMIIEPFCYGAAVFILSYRISRKFTLKLLYIVIAITLFLWIDDIWPSLASRHARIGVASANQEFSQLFSEQHLLGQAQYYTGEESGLFEIFRINFLELGLACLCVPLAFFLGLKITNRRWNESNAFSHKPPRIVADFNIPPPCK